MAPFSPDQLRNLTNVTREPGVMKGTSGGSSKPIDDIPGDQSLLGTLNAVVPVVPEGKIFSNPATQTISSVELKQMATTSVTTSHESGPSGDTPDTLEFNDQ